MRFIDSEFLLNDLSIVENRIEKLEKLVKFLPCMRSPTVAPLYKEEGYAVKIAVDKSDVLDLIPKLKKYGAKDILEYEISKVVL